MNKLYSWFGAAAIVVVVFGTVYATVQQSQRSDANWLQIELSENTKALLDAGHSPSDVIGAPVEISTNLTPFVDIYDKSGNPVAGNGVLHRKLPQVPIGVLKASDKKEYHAVTWQPEKDVRIAAVTVSAKDYYVLSGRSLREVEKNESRTFHLAFLGGLLSWAILMATYQMSKTSSKRM